MEHAASRPSPSRATDLAWVAALVVLYGALHLPGLGHPPALVGDEAWYVPAARAWLTPGALDPNPNHPPLGKMLIATGMAVLGDQPLGWRVASSLFGLLSVLLTFAFGRALFRSPLAAGLAGALVATDFLAFTESRLATLDTFVSFFLLAGLYCGWRAARAERPVAWLSAAGAMLGLATATKLNGLSGLPILLCFAFLRPRELPRWPLWAAAPVLGALVATFALVHLPLVARGAPPSWMLYAGNLQHHYGGTFQHEQMGSMLDWVTLRRPFWFLFANDQASQRLTMLGGWGNFVLWWGFWPILAARVASRRRPDLAVACSYLGLWLSWLASLETRNGALALKGGFFYYMLPCVPFMALAVGRQLSLAARSPRGLLAGALFLGTMAWVAVLFWPTLVAEAIPYARMDQVLALVGGVQPSRWAPWTVLLAAGLAAFVLLSTPPGDPDEAPPRAPEQEPASAPEQAPG